MELFKNEVINITKIHTVDFYNSKEMNPNLITKSYNTNLPTYELIFYLSGNNRTQFGSHIINDAPNTIRYLPKESGDSVYRVESFEHSECIDIYFDTDGDLPPFAIGLKDMNELKPLFTKIYNIWSSKKRGYYTRAMSVMYDIINAIKKHNDKYITKSRKERLLPAHEYMLENYTSENFDYKEMCSRTSLSYDYFKELFVNNYGMTPIKYITMLRMEKAKELLITGHYKVSEIAGMCGFENVYYFSNVFKKHEGISPKNYIKK